MPEEGQQWYSNKELFEQINESNKEFLKQINGICLEIKDLRAEMRETRETIKKYNGLREEVRDLKGEITETKSQVQEIKARGMGRNATLDAIRAWGGWILAIAAFILTIVKT